MFVARFVAAAFGVVAERATLLRNKLRTGLCRAGYTLYPYIIPKNCYDTEFCHGTRVPTVYFMN